MKKSKQDQRNHCKLKGDCWQWDFMFKKNFSVEEIYKVCRKCIYFKPQMGGIVNDETLEEIFKK